MLSCSNGPPVFSYSNASPWFYYALPIFSLAMLPPHVLFSNDPSFSDAPPMFSRSKAPHMISCSKAFPMFSYSKATVFSCSDSPLMFFSSEVPHMSQIFCPPIGRPS